MKQGKELLESYSNLAYNLAGLYALLFHNDVLFCMALQALSVGSLVYHYNKTRPIFLFDWWAMNFVVTIIIGMTIPGDEVWKYVVAGQVVYGYFILGKLNVYIEVGLSVAPCLVAILVYKPLSHFGVVVAIFLVALYIRSKDEDPEQAKFHDSWEQSVWHILTAVGFLLAVYL